MKNKIEDLRNHLFVTIERLLDEDDPMEISRAKAVSDAAQAVINSAKVEVDFLRITGGIEGSGFIPYEPRNPLPPGKLDKKQTVCRTCLHTYPKKGADHVDCNHLLGNRVRDRRDHDVFRKKKQREAF